MWTVIHIAANRAQADMMKGLLESEGLMAEVRPAGISMLGDGLFEVMTLESEGGRGTGNSVRDRRVPMKKDEDSLYGRSEHR